jgi:DNA-binding response OmpR family regulator
MQRVLIISADLEWANFYRWALHTAGFQVSSAENGQTGLQLARSQPPDGILIEPELPDKNGLWVLRQLRQHGFGQTPIILLTSTFDLPSIEMAFDAGASTVLDRRTSSGTDVVKIFNYVLRLRLSKPQTAFNPWLAPHERR